MQEVSVDLANAEPGETCFLLQVRLPDTPGGEGGALMDKVSRFVGLYLSAAQPEPARYAQMGALNWMIAAPEEALTALVGLRADLSTTLFGGDDPERVQLEAPGLDIADFAEDGEVGVDEAPLEQDETFLDEDIDAGAQDDVWLEGGEAGASSQTETSDMNGQEVFVVDADEAPEPVESFDIEAGEFEADPGLPDRSARDDDDEDWEIAGASAACRAAFDDESDVFEVDGLDIEIVDGDVPDCASVIEIDNFMHEAAAPETLTETPPRPVDRDVAGELAAFRAEMREIALGISADDGGQALTAFRAELDAIAGSMGQRVDGAAQRIEAAADRIEGAGERFDGARLDAAAARAEASAERLESGVEDALSALNAAIKAMAGAPTGDAVNAGG